MIQNVAVIHGVCGDEPMKWEGRKISFSSIWWKRFLASSFRENARGRRRGGRFGMNGSVTACVSLVGVDTDTMRVVSVDDRYSVWFIMGRNIRKIIDAATAEHMRSTFPAGTLFPWITPNMIGHQFMMRKI